MNSGKIDPQSPKVKSIDVDGNKIYYIEQGSGIPVVLVHGTLGDYRSWRKQMDPFAEDYRTIAVSRRYHYPGTWTGGHSDYSAEGQGEDIALLIERLQLGPTHVVASSFGAFVSLFTAMNHSRLVRSLVLGEPPAFPILDTTPDGPSYWIDFDRRAWTPARNLLEKGEDESGVEFFLDGVLGPGSYKKLPHPARQMLLDNVSALKAEVTSADYLSDLRCESVRRIQTPTLLIGGMQSPAMFHRIADELARCLPNCERATVPDASHAIHNQNAAFYNRVVLDFLKRH
ncbi:MAG TPA: alpha/beta hydrolase [Bacteroidota bacterium]|nr:alpha/beta hydrolase [Bacteroidota bacterium]